MTNTAFAPAMDEIILVATTVGTTQPYTTADEAVRRCLAALKGDALYQAQWSALIEVLRGL